MLYTKVGIMKFLLFLSSFLLSLTVFAHCPMEFKEVDLCANLKWIDGPHLDQKSHFQLTFWEKGDLTHTPVSPELEIDIYSWMTMHNGNSHGGPKMNFQEISTGVFEVKDARFFMHGMHGYWEIKADLFEGDSVVSSSASRIDFNNNGGGHHH